MNRKLFSVHQALDHYFFRPAAMAYKTVVPKPLRTGIRHVIANIGEPIVFLNDVLQLKPKRAIKTLARFGINSTLGLGGVLDLAKAPRLGLPHHNNGFGNTLGRYGVGPGPYLFLPLVGPTDFRDFFGGQADGAVLPLAIGKPFNRPEYLVPHAVAAGLDLRAQSDDELKALLDQAVDPYASLRSAYLQSRAAEVGELRHKAVGGTSPLDDPLADPDAPKVTPPAVPEPAVPPPADFETPADPDTMPAKPVPPPS